jgi:prevent-host-death family protein
MRVTATEAKNRFGALCAQAKREPVIVEKAGLPDTVLMSYDEFQRLHCPSAAEAAGRQEWFSTTYKDWIDAHNDLVEKYGVFGEEYRPW